MNKAVIVINGSGGVGKDTLCELAGGHFRVYNMSTIMPVKDIAAQCGWDGAKDDRSRKFLSDLKSLLAEYNDYPTLWAKERFLEFMASENEIMFMHIREPQEIVKFVNATEGVAKTLLVRGGDRMTKAHYGNRSDDEVENFEYDYYFTNDKSLGEAEEDFCRLLSDILAGK